MADPIDLLIKDREGVVFEGKVESVSGINDKGPFDILPSHANFISLVNQSLKIRLPDGGVKEIMVDNGVVKVKENRVDVYLGIKR